MTWKAVSFDDAAKKRIADASSFEKQLRLEGAINLDFEIAGLKLRQITIKDLLFLEFSENRLITGEEPQFDDLVFFVLSISNDKPFFKNRYARKVGRLIRDYPEFRQEIICYFNVCFNDMPTSKDDDNSSNSKSSVAVMTLVDTLACNYGWSFQEILDTPISSALQLLQRIMLRKTEKYSLRNPITQLATAHELQNIKENG
jgi:hypothetical protein